MSGLKWQFSADLELANRSAQLLVFPIRKLAEEW